MPLAALSTMRGAAGRGIARRFSVARRSTPRTPPLTNPFRSAGAAVGRLPQVSRPWSSSVGHSSGARGFSSEGAAAELARLLQREQEEEARLGNLEVPPELTELRERLEAAGWRVADGASARLVRSLPDGGTAQVGFHVQDTVLDEAAAAFLEEGDGAEVDVDDLAARVRFTVTVARAGRTLVLTCLGEGTQATIEGAAVVTGAASVDEALKTGGVPPEQYQGPEFGELAEDLQESFHVYLQDHVGIDEDVASFISMYADYREQVEYVQFLKDAQTVLKR